MVRLVLPLLLGLGAIVFTGCAQPEADESARSSADIVVGGTDTDAKTPKAKSKRKTEVDKPLVPIYVDQQTGTPIAAPVQTGPSGALTLDGNPCSITKMDLNTAATANGWTLTIEADCSSKVTFKVSGTTDGAYPQTSAVAFAGTPAAVLTISDPEGQATFDSSADGGDSLVEEGPTSAAKADVWGSALVSDSTTFASHDVAYDVEFPDAPAAPTAAAPVEPEPSDP